MKCKTKMSGKRQVTKKGFLNLSIKVDTTDSSNDSIEKEIDYSLQVEQRLRILRRQHEEAEKKSNEKDRQPQSDDCGPNNNDFYSLLSSKRLVKELET